MTALSVWWRRNFGHRNDPPAMLPDPVRWTVTVHRSVVREHIGKAVNNGWTADPVGADGDLVTVRLTREDGAYRWRDDGFVGF